MRRFAAVWRACDPVPALILLSVATAVVLSARDLPWRGEWAWTLDWAAGTTVLAGPLTAGLAAYQTARWRPITTQLLLPTARRRVAACFTPASAALASAILVYVVGTLVALAISTGYHPTDRFVPYLTLIGAGQLAACTAIGTLVGTRLRPYVAAPLAVVAGYALNVLASGHSTLAFWLVGGSTGPDSGKVLDVRYTSGAALLFVGVAGAATALGLIQSTTTRLVAQVSGGVSVALMGLGLVLTSAPGSTYDRVDPQPHRVCRGSLVSVCLLAGNTSQLDSWSGLMNQAAARIRTVGLAYPPRYEQPTADTHSLTSGLIFFDPGTINIRPPSHLYVAESLATPADCPAYSSDRPPISALNAREWLAQLIVQRVWPQDQPAGDPRVVAWQKQTPIGDQDRWARATFAGLRACTLSSIAVPDGR